jgi:hypothetical protein
MKTRFLSSCLVIFSLVLLPALLLSPAVLVAEDFNDIAYQHRFLLKAGTVLNRDGIGDCLIFPYYDARILNGNSQSTQISIENSGENGIAAKLRVREWSRGAEVFSRDIWIPSGGVWSGRIDSNEEGTNGRIRSSDSVIIRSDANGFYLSTPLSEGVPFSLKGRKGSPALYGYIEVIGEERTSTEISGGKIPRVAKSERDCPNTLRGTAFIHRIEDGLSMGYEAVAIGNFSRGQGSLFRSPGSPYPRLDNCEDTLDQLEFQLSKWEIFGPYSARGSEQGNTSLIVTFPTKHFHYQKGGRISQNDNPFEASVESVGESVKTSVSDPEGNILATEPDIRLPYSVNVVGLYPVHAKTPVGIDNLSYSTAPHETGEITLTSDNIAHRVLIDDYEYLQERFSIYRGLPAVGLVLSEYRNPDPVGSIVPVEFSAVWESSDLESVFIPAAPNGPAFGTTGTSYTYMVGGSASSLGHPIQYFIDWGDGTNSGWLDSGVTSVSKTWTVGGTFNVRARARCLLHPEMMSAWSPVLVVTVEAISPPTLISGPLSGIPNTSYTYTASGSISSLGHPIEYQFDWGDGTTSEWGTGPQNKTWIEGAVFSVKARGRCTLHPEIVSAWSSGLEVTIETVSVPSIPVGPPIGTIGTSFSFSTGGAVSNLRHPVEYQFDWADGTFSPWGPPVQSKSWNAHGEYKIRARARCVSDPSVISEWSAEFSFVIESISAPYQPTGPLSGMRGAPLTYTAVGAMSILGHPLEYQFDWGDGSASPWGAASFDVNIMANTGTQSKIWNASGVYTIKARARCQLHPNVITAWSPGLVVVVEFVTTPTTPTGPTTGTVGEGYLFASGTSSSDRQPPDPVQYRFEWGDGTTSEWLPIGVSSVGKAWNQPGTYGVRAQARCATHTSVISNWSEVFVVTISPNVLPPQTETISTPFIEDYGSPDRGSLYEVSSNRISGTKNASYTFRIRPGASNLDPSDHQIESKVDWGDGTFSEWQAGDAFRKSWSTSRAQPYAIKVRSRCKQHPTIVSEWSSGIGIVIDYITAPDRPTWDTVITPPAVPKPSDGIGHMGQEYQFTTAGGSHSDIGQEIQYRFQWGDGASSGWLDVGTKTATHTYLTQGIYTVRVEARGWWYLGAELDTEHFSYYSPELIVTIRP